MQQLNSLRVGYVVKRYPRYSETFIVNEILAHEKAGLELKIFSLRPSFDGHFQDRIARVRAPVTYLLGESVKSSEFWASLHEAAAVLPGLWGTLPAAGKFPVGEVYQAILLARHVKSLHLTHLHAHFATSATTVAQLAARFAQVPYSFTAHAKDIFHESVHPEDLAAKLRGASSVVTVSDYNVRYLRENYRDAAAGVRRVYNGLDMGEFPYRAPDKRAARIISVGRLVEKKGFEDLIHACALLAQRNANFTCQIIGGGELQARLAAQINQLGLQGQVELLGPRPQSQVIELVQGAAVLAAPCVVGDDGNRDGLPTVLLEAMALGTPCISTDVTGIPEILHHEETGLLVPQHDPAALSLALERLLGDTELRVRLAGLARELIEANFDIDRNTAFLRELFRAGQRSAAGQGAS